MKKLLILLSLSVMLNSCKQKEAAPESTKKTKIQPMTAARPDCSFFDPLETMNSSEQVVWLRENQKEACLDKYDICREIAHTISEENYRAGLAAYWEEKPPIYSKFELSYIKGLATTTGYEKFVGTSFNGDNIQLAAVTNFKENPVCFSFPLFYSLEHLYTLDPKQNFIFTKAIIGGHQTIVFQIAGTSKYYDMAQYPL